MIPLHISWDQFQPNVWESISFLWRGRRFRMIIRETGTKCYLAYPFGGTEPSGIFPTLEAAQEYCRKEALSQSYDTDQQRRQRPRRLPDQPW